MLTGQAKIDFAKWYNKFLEKNDYINNEFPIPFLTLPLSMQSGVYLEFLREQGKIIEVYSQSSKPKLTYGYKIVQDGGNLLDDGFADYNTALTRAIEKCNELINGEQK